MARENQKEAVFNLQTYLRHLSYLNEEIGEVPLDGVFDEATRDALTAFQALSGLPETGVADATTWERLYEAYSASVNQKTTPSRIAHFPEVPENHQIALGEVQFLVRVIQNALEELSVVYEGLDEVPQSGVYDADTAEAVEAFQRAQGLPATGAVDRATWNALADAYNRHIQDPHTKQ